jgi:hypothetical protein
MRNLRWPAAAACAVALLVCSCDKQSSVPGVAPKAVEEKIPPYSYPAPVKGHLKEVNIGEFDLVDGIAYTPTVGSGTVVYVVSKPIASPLLADAACPLTQARALSKLRNASYAEITLDAAGHSRYLAAGTPFDGSWTDLTAGDWSSTAKEDAGRVQGNVLDRRRGHFDFDLPVSNPKFDQISYGDRRKLSPTTPKPTEQAITATYLALHDAAQKKNLQAMLAALGFDAKQSAAIRGMDGIEADFAVFADRFLTPGTPGDPWNRPGTGQVRGEGAKANGKKFVNDYYFDLCGEKLVLTTIVEQPAP